MQHPQRAVQPLDQHVFVVIAHRPFYVGIDDETFPPGLAAIPAAGYDNIVIAVFFCGLISAVS